MPSSIRNDLARASAESAAHVAATVGSIEDTARHLRDSRGAIDQSLRLLALLPRTAD